MSKPDKSLEAKIAAERAVIGSLLVETYEPMPAAIVRVIKFAPDSFDDLRLGQVAKAIKNLWEEQKPVGILTVQGAVNGELSKDPLLSSYLSELCTQCGRDIAEYEAELVWESFRSRRLKTVYADAVAAMETAPGKADLIADGVQRSIVDLARAKDAGELFSLKGPAALDLMEFDESDRILGDRLLAKGQSLVITGAGSLGKSRLALQLVAAVVAGRQFVSLETRGEDFRWLILQAENSNRRLQADLRALKDWLNPYEWDRLCRNVFIHTLETDADFLLSLDHPRARDNISKAIELTLPDGILFDSLYNFGIGDLNKDEDMAETLLTISRLCKQDNPERCPVLLHHAATGKAGVIKALGYDRASFARNSKVLHSWTRGQINVSPGSPDPDEGLLVLSCGKCSNGREFSPFAIRLNPISMIYEVEPDFNLTNWQDEAQGKKPPVTDPDDIASLLIVPMTRTELRKEIMEKRGGSRETAYAYIRQALKPTRKDRKPTIQEDEKTGLLTPT